MGLIWFDTPCAITTEQAKDLREFVYALQPACLVSGRIGGDGGDYGSLGDNQIPAGRVAGDWETPATMNDTWGFKSYDHNWKPVEYLLRLLVQCASKGVNYMLNVGPTAEGVIPEPSVERLQVIGQWMKTNGESVYGTQQSPFPCDFPWGRVTCKPGHVYLHLFKWPGREFALAGLRCKVLGARLLADGREIVPFRQDHDQAADYHLLRLTLPEAAPDPYVSVVALDLDGPLDVDPLPAQQPDGGLLLPAYLARLEGPPEMRLEACGFLDGWNSPDGRLAWSFRLREPGRYRVFVQTFLDREGAHWLREKEGRERYGNHRMRVTVEGETVVGMAGRKDMIMDERVNRWHAAESDLGEISVPGAGERILTLGLEQRDPASEFGPTVCGVRLARIQ